MNQAVTAPATQLVPIHAMGRDMAIECLWIAPEKTDKDLLVFLHEGLGSASMWKDWPAQVCAAADCRGLVFSRSEEHTSELQSLMRISYAVFCLKKNKLHQHIDKRREQQTLSTNSDS